MLGIVSAVFGTITETLTEFFNVISTGINSVVELFYTIPESGGVGEFTFLGTLLMIGLGVGLVWTLIKWISGLVRNVAR